MFVAKQLQQKQNVTEKTFRRQCLDGYFNNEASSRETKEIMQRK